MFRRFYSFIYNSFPKSKSSVIIAGALYLAMCFGLVLGSLVVLSLNPDYLSNATHGNNTTKIGIAKCIGINLTMIENFMDEHSYIVANTHCVIWGVIFMTIRACMKELHLNSFSLFLLAMISEFIAQGYYVRSWLEIDLPEIYYYIILFMAASIYSVQTYTTLTLLLHFISQKVEIRMLPRSQGIEVIVERKNTLTRSISCPLYLSQDIKTVLDESNLTKNV